MRQKLNDACALANRQRQAKNVLRRKLMVECKGERERFEKILERTRRKIQHRKNIRRKKNEKKFMSCRLKQERQKIQDEIPSAAWEMVKDLNIFEREKVEPEPLKGPMVCSTDLELSKEEIAFLTKGSKFMLRNKLDRTEYNTEIEKVIAKQSYGACEDEDEMELTGEKRDKSIEKKIEKVETESRLIYNKENKLLDMGNLRASDYKFNRFIHLPRPEKAEKETLHDIRRRVMRKVFDNLTKDDTKKRKTDERKREKEKVDSNLTREEEIGLKRLKKRVKEGDVIITETDKSKKFCVMKKDQYILSGQKHTAKDSVVTIEQARKIQKIVNGHSGWLANIFQYGENWHHSERVVSSMIDNSESIAPLYLLIKDHKNWSETSGEPPPSRPVCSGNSGMNKQLSEIVSHILESLAHSIEGADIDSTGELLLEIRELNKRREKKSCEEIPGEMNIRSKREEKKMKRENSVKTLRERELKN